MQSIETEYAGYRFRSRLEARWAVFFDNATIEFDYEPEGFLLPWRYREQWYPRSTKFRYLPDFWLPDLGLWGEVKGRWSAHEHIKAINGAAALSDAGSDVLLLADTFRQPRGGSRRPWLLRMEGGELVAYPWPPVDGVRELIASDRDPEALSNSIDLLRGYVGDEPLDPTFLAAMKAAQKSRFEFGERG